MEVRIWYGKCSIGTKAGVEEYIYGVLHIWMFMNFTGAIK